tara:strand:+ start:152 stop:541 length:390 start_codon:yes stop_codon:yes gene_type:complete
MEYIYQHYNYWVAVLLMMIGFYAVITSYNLVKKMIGLAIFQVSVLLLYISVAFVKGGSSPIIVDGQNLYMNPLPHVLMLTAIVVGVSVMAVGLALIACIKREYDTVEENEMMAMDASLNEQERQAEEVS